MRAPALSLRVDDANVARALPATSRIVLDVELDLLALLERVELARAKGGVVKKDLRAVLGANEAEPTVSDQTHNGTCCHDLYTPLLGTIEAASTRATGRAVFGVLERVPDFALCRSEGDRPGWLTRDVEERRRGPSPPHRARCADGPRRRRAAR